MKKMILEARINEYAMRDKNPHVPWTPSEIADCAARCREAGASIVHFHARTPDGAPEHSVASYADTIHKIRAKCDVLIHPTLGWFSNDGDPSARAHCVTSLALDPATRPDFAPIDTGSTNLETFADGQFQHAERVYINRTDTLMRYATEFAAVGIKPIIVTWSIGFTRRAAALMEMGLVAEPAYFLLNMTDGAYLTGHPGTEAGLDAHLRFLPPGRRIEWASNVVGGDLLKLTRMSAERGGHIAPGIGDYPYVELGCPTNEQVIALAAEAARAAGREIATPDDARALLGMGAAHAAQH